MQVTIEDLRKRYRLLSDDEIIELYEKGELTEAAFSVLDEELKRRGLTPDRIQEIESGWKAERLEEIDKATPVKVPKGWIGFMLAAASLLARTTLKPWDAEDIGYIIRVLAAIYYLFCVYRFHKFLDQLSIEKYKVRPSDAVAYHFIPFFNIYWLFKWPTELQKFLTKLGDIRIMPGFLMGLLIAASFAITNLVNLTIGLLCLFGTTTYIGASLREHPLCTAKSIVSKPELKANLEHEANEDIELAGEVVDAELFTYSDVQNSPWTCECGNINATGSKVCAKCHRNRESQVG